MKILVAVVSGLLLLAAILAYPVAYNLVEPSFSVQADRLATGDHVLEIKPNFVVNSIYRITIASPAGTVAERDTPEQGTQTIEIPGSLPSGTTISVECQLQYDRLAGAAIRTARQSVVLP